MCIICMTAPDPKRSLRVPTKLTPKAVAAPARCRRDWRRPVVLQVPESYGLSLCQIANVRIAGLTGRSRESIFGPRRFTGDLWQSTAARKACFGSAEPIPK